MRTWQAVCLAEAAALLLVWLLLDGVAAPPAAEGEVEQQAVSPAAAPAAASPQTAAAAEEPERTAEATASSAAGPRPWSAPAAGILLLAEVQDEQGKPVKDGSGHCWQEGEETKRPIFLQSEHRLTLSDLQPGSLHVELRSAGFLPFEDEVAIAPEPATQRRILRLQRARRVLLHLRTPSGEPLQAWLAREWNWTSSQWRLQAALAREPFAGNLQLLERAPFNHELGEFRPADGRIAGLPKDCAGAVDVRATAPLHVGAWLGNAFLGTAPIPDGAEEVTILLDERSLRGIPAEVRLRVVDAATGAPLAQATVSIGFPWGGGGPRRRTGEDGWLVFAGLAPDRRDLEISFPERGEAYRSLYLHPGERVDLGDVTLGRAGRIRARLLGADGTPLGQHGYQFFPTGGWNRPEDPRRSSSRTDKEGWLDFRAGPERHQVIVGGGAHGVQAVVWERGSEEAGEREIRLAPGAEVRIRATQESNLPRALWLLDAEGRILSGFWTTPVQSKTIVLAAGLYLLRVEDLDRNLLGTLDLLVPEGGGDLDVALP